MPKPMTALAVDELIEDMIVPVTDLAEMEPDESWPPEIANVVTAAKAMCARYGLGVVIIKL